MLCCHRRRGAMISFCIGHYKLHSQCCFDPPYTLLPPNSLLPSLYWLIPCFLKTTIYPCLSLLPWFSHKDSMGSHFQHVVVLMRIPQMHVITLSSGPQLLIVKMCSWSPDCIFYLALQNTGKQLLNSSLFYFGKIHLMWQSFVSTNNSSFPLNGGASLGPPRGSLICEHLMRWGSEWPNQVTLWDLVPCWPWHLNIPAFTVNSGNWAYIEHKTIFIS